MNQATQLLYPFLKAVRGNWRNALLLKCDSVKCPYGQTSPCNRYLLTADAEGALLLMPVSYFECLTGETIIPDECAGSLTRQSFEQIYHLYIDWHAGFMGECPVKQLYTDFRSRTCHDK